MKRRLTAVVSAAAWGCLVSAGCTRPQPTTTGPGGISTSPGSSSVRPDSAASAPTPGSTGIAAPAAPPPRPTTVKISIKSKPPKATVFWGKKKLGVTPFVLERPRDSTPLDLVVRAPGYFTVHTRAYTFRNDRLYVELTALEDRMTLFGAKKELPPPEPSPDALPPAEPAPTDATPAPLAQPAGPLQ